MTTISLKVPGALLRELEQEAAGEPLAVLEFFLQGALSLAFDACRELAPLFKLQRSYRELPMDFADACLVRMTELHPRSRVLTTDSHFQLFRRNRRQVIPRLAPDS